MRPAAGRFFPRRGSLLDLTFLKPRLNSRTSEFSANLTSDLLSPLLQHRPMDQSLPGDRHRDIHLDIGSVLDR